MIPKIEAEIEQMVARGMDPRSIANELVSRGYPPALVAERLDIWLAGHGRKQPKTDFWQWLKKYKTRAIPAVTAVVAISLITSATMLLKPWPTKIMVDSAFGNLPAPGPLEPYSQTAELILITSLMTLIIFIVGAIFATVRDYVVLKLGFRLNRDIKEESFRHILHMPLYHQERLAKGDYIYRQNVLTNSLSDLVLDTASSIIQNSIMVVGILVIMLYFNVKLTIISIILIPFLFFLIKLFGPKLSKISQALTKNNSAISSATTEAVDNAETVQAFTLEEKELGKVNKLWWDNYHYSRSGLLWSRLYRSTNSFLIIIASSAVMYFGGVAALSHQMTLGELLIFMTYMGYLLGPIETIASEIAARNQKLVDIGRVYEVLTDHEGVEDLRAGQHLPPIKGAIEFQSIEYAYTDRAALKNINLKIEPGEKVGIIGPSGGGKSTLLKLVPLFIEPSAGRILIDGYDIQTVSLKDLRQRVAWISQSPQLFSGTVAENLTDGDVYRQINEQEMNIATEAANAKEFIDKMPEHLSSPTGEGGVSLSGGQKQRLAIARGLIKNAPIVCMDEPTAALDSKSEQHIRDSIEKLIHGKTVMMVTHRKALLTLMDKIYVMEDGVLSDVRQFGGLDAYLAKIQDIEGREALAHPGQAMDQKQTELLELQKRRLRELEAENVRLQQSADRSRTSPARQAEDDTGTIYIHH